MPHRYLPTSHRTFGGFDDLNCTIVVTRIKPDKDVLARNGRLRVMPWKICCRCTGGNHRMRAYYEGHIADKNAISGQLEYHIKLSWRHGVVGWAQAPWDRLCAIWMTVALYGRGLWRGFDRASTCGWITAWAKLAAVLFSGRRSILAGSVVRVYLFWRCCFWRGAPAPATTDALSVLATPAAERPTMPPQPLPKGVAAVLMLVTTCMLPSCWDCRFGFIG